MCHSSGNIEYSDAWGYLNWEVPASEDSEENISVGPRKTLCHILTKDNAAICHCVKISN